jgi:uncharacterized membrane protein
MDVAKPGGDASPDLEHIWEFAGQGLRSSDFTSAMVHFYRGEMSRSNSWRARLDATTNWAVITTGAALTFVFSDVGHTPLVLLIDTLFVLLFLFIEARRYRYYELWTYRVRIMETNFFAALLSPPFMPHTEWADQIKDSLHNPRFPIGLLEALGRRYRRTYAPIFLILAASWVAKIYLHPLPTNNLNEFMERAAVGPVPGWLMILIGFIFNGLIIGLGMFTVGLRDTSGEVLGEWSGGLAGLLQRLRHATWEVLETDLPLWPRLDPRKQLAYIIADEAEQIGQVLLEELKRGVTLLHAKGMYSGKERGVLMCVLEARRVARLKQLVHELDPEAFVIITPVHDVRGTGFRPLET